MAQSDGFEVGAVTPVTRSGTFEFNHSQEIAALQSVVMEIVDHKALARDQKTCQGVADHLRVNAQNQSKSVKLSFHQVLLWCVTFLMVKKRDHSRYAAQLFIEGRSIKPTGFMVALCIQRHNHFCLELNIL